MGVTVFAKDLFEQPKSGSLDVDKETLEDHLRKTYSDANRKNPLEDTDGIEKPGAPNTTFNVKQQTLDEVKKVVSKARNKSSPGPNGIPYLLYKKCPNVLE